MISAVAGVDACKEVEMEVEVEDVEMAGVEIGCGGDLRDLGGMCEDE